MSYFLVKNRSWSTSGALCFLPEDMLLPKDRSCLGYKNGASVRKVEAAVERLVEEKYGDRGKVRGKLRARVAEYYEKLPSIEPADVVIVTGTDTVSAKPPHVLRKLAPDHPSNLCVRVYSSLLRQLKSKKGKTGYIAVVDPPYLPAVVTEQGLLHPSLRNCYFRHGFTHWNDIDAQREKYGHILRRSEAFRAAYERYFPEWERDFPVQPWDEGWEKELQTAAKGVAIERLSDFVVDKCNDRLFVVMPNYGIMGGIKQGIISSVKLRKPSVIGKEELVDVVKPCLSTENYKRDLTCSVSVRNKMATYLENIYRFRAEKEALPKASDRLVNAKRPAQKCPFGGVLSEWAPSRGSHCIYKDDKTKCMRHALEEVLDEQCADEAEKEKVRAFLKERRIHIPSVNTVVNMLNFDLYDDLEPVPLPDLDVDRKNAETSCSEVSGAANAPEFFLRRQGLLDVPDDVKFLGKVGTICHEAMYRFAPRRYKKGMEKAAIRTLSMLGDEEPTTLHMKPDIVTYYGDEMIITIDTKSGPAFYESWLARKSHRLQVSGYSWHAEMAAEDSVGLELKGAYGVVLHLQDFYTGEPTFRKFRTDQESPDRKAFFSKVRSMVGHKRKWEAEPELFLKDFSDDSRAYSFRNTLESKRMRHAWPAVIKFAELHGLDSKYKSFLDEIRAACKSRGVAADEETKE
ncbi:MAG: hypothetical protein QXD77_02025 [Candidatus Aenigmatarchaeota archaeon]